MSEVISRETLSLVVILLITSYFNIRSEYPAQPFQERQWEILNWLQINLVQFSRDSSDMFLLFFLHHNYQSLEKAEEIGGHSGECACYANVNTGVQVPQNSCECWLGMVAYP